jgi:DNA polymerase-1
VSLENVQVHFVDSMEEVASFKRWLGERRPGSMIGCDTESTGLNKQTDYARTVQFGDAEHGWTIPVEDWKGVIKEVIGKFEGTYVGHNWPFDDAMLANAGITPPPQSKIHDTRMMHHPLEPTFSTALKPLASRYVDPRAGAAQTDLDEAIAQHGWDGIPLDFPPYWVYASLDPVITVQLHDVLRPRVDAQCPKAYDLELATSWVTHRMERYGAHVDRPYAVKAQAEFEDYIERASDWCRAEYGISAGSNQGVIDVLVSEGYDFTKRTPGGSLALDKEVLAGIDHPLARTVLQRRQLQKLSKSYLGHLIGEADSDDLIHCSMNSIGARTGRKTIKNPALQTLPRWSEDNRAAITIRNCFSARPGHTLLMCDFDQIEMRILAYLSKDPGLLAAFHAERDFFIDMACRLFDVEDMAKSDPRRSLTKNSSYAKVYMSGIAKLAVTAGVSEGAAAKFMKTFDEMFSGVSTFISETMEEAMGAVQTEGVAAVYSPLTGRRHTADKYKEYAIVNYKIQGTAAEIFKMKILEIDAAGMGQWLSLPVHDEVIMDVPNEHVPDVVQALGQIMNDNQIIAPVPVSASVSYGQRWGSKRSWDLDEWRASLAS